MRSVRIVLCLFALALFAGCGKQPEPPTVKAYLYKGDDLNQRVGSLEKAQSQVTTILPKMDQKIDVVDRKVEGVDQKYAHEVADLKYRISALEGKSPRTTGDHQGEFVSTQRGWAPVPVASPPAPRPEPAPRPATKQAPPSVHRSLDELNAGLDRYLSKNR